MSHSIPGKKQVQEYEYCCKLLDLLASTGCRQARKQPL